MRKKLLRLALALIFTVSGYGIPTTPTTHAQTQPQCGCSCTYLCSGTCNVTCSDCTISGAVETAARCCSQEKKNVEQYCPQDGGQV